MGDQQDRGEETGTTSGTPGEPVHGGRSGEGAASALQQVITQHRQRQQNSEADQSEGQGR